MIFIYIKKANAKNQENPKTMEKSYRTLSQSSKMIKKDSISPLSSIFNAFFFHKECPSSSPIDSNYKKERLEKKQNDFNQDKNKSIFNQLQENDKRKKYTNFSRKKFLDSVIRRISVPPKKKGKKEEEDDEERENENKRKKSKKRKKKDGKK